MHLPMILLFSLFFSHQAFAQTIDVNLSDNSLRAEYSRPFNNANFNRAEIDGSLFFTTDDEKLLTLGFKVVDEAGGNVPGLEAGIGVRAFGGGDATYDIFALGMGGHVRYTVPGMTRLKLFGRFHYAPDIISFMDARRLVESAGRIEYAVLPQASLYLGYRKIDVDLTSGVDLVLDKSGHVGLIMTF